MTRPTTSLDPFDPLELLRLLEGRGSTGLFTVTHPQGQFEAWLEEGRVRHLHFGDTRGAAALARLLRHPQGHFSFEPGLRVPGPTLDASLDQLVWEALDDLPAGEPGFDGPAQLTAPERLDHLPLSLAEREVLRQIGAGQPLAEVARDPETRRLVVKLTRLGLLAPRSSRIARLTVGVTRAGTGLTLVDAQIHRRWQGAQSRPLAQVAVRREDGTVVTLAVRAAPDLGPRLLVPAELLLRTGLRAGESVLVQPG